MSFPIRFSPAFHQTLAQPGNKLRLAAIIGAVFASIFVVTLPATIPLIVGAYRKFKADYNANVRRFENSTFKPEKVKVVTDPEVIARRVKFDEPDPSEDPNIMTIEVIARIPAEVDTEEDDFDVKELPPSVKLSYAQCLEKAKAALEIKSLGSGKLVRIGTEETLDASGVAEMTRLAMKLFEDQSNQKDFKAKFDEKFKDMSFVQAAEHVFKQHDVKRNALGLLVYSKNSEEVQDQALIEQIANQVDDVFKASQAGRVTLQASLEESQS